LRSSIHAAADDSEAELIKDAERRGDGRGVFREGKGGGSGGDTGGGSGGGKGGGKHRKRGTKRPRGRHVQAAEALQKFVADDHSTLADFVQTFDPSGKIAAKRLGDNWDPSRGAVTCASKRMLDMFLESRPKELSELMASQAGFGHLKWLLEAQQRSDRDWERSRARFREEQGYPPLPTGGASSSSGGGWKQSGGWQHGGGWKQGGGSKWHHGGGWKHSGGWR